MFIVKKILLGFFALCLAIPGAFTAPQDSYSAYKKAVKNVDIYENTIDTAVPMTEVYRLVNEFFAEELPAGKTEKKVAILGYDGCRADALSLMGDAENSGIKTLMNDGGKAVIAYCGGKPYPNINPQATSTAPGWCSMLTGQWADVHGVDDNGVEKSNDYLTMLTSLVENGTIDDSAFYVSWSGHFNGDGTTYIREKRYAEEKGLDVTFRCNSGDSGTFAATLADINSADCSDFIFSIFEFCDHEGHGDNFYIGNENYQNGFAESEMTSKACIDAIKARPTYAAEDWLIIITSDHGGIGSGHGGVSIQERMTFIITNKDVYYNYPMTGIVC